MNLIGKLELLYPGEKFYGIYKRKSDGRSYLVRTIPGSKKNKKSSIMLSRALMEAELGRRLDKNEEVDHKDRNCLNDSIDNLQVLLLPDHREKTGLENSGPKTAKMTVCPSCKKEFLCSDFRIKVALKKDRQPCCSKYCSQTYYGANQHGWTGDSTLIA